VLRKGHDADRHTRPANNQFRRQRIEKITNPTPTQRRAFELIGAPIPLTLTDR
jgi:hypothetical protein